MPALLLVQNLLRCFFYFIYLLIPSICNDLSNDLSKLMELCLQHHVISLSYVWASLGCGNVGGLCSCNTQWGVEG